MFELFLYNFTDLIKSIGIDIIFLSSLALVVILSLTSIVISLIKKRYSQKNRLWIVFLFAGIFLMEMWAEFIIAKKTLYFLILLGVISLFLSVVLFIPEKCKKSSVSQKALAKFLDDCVKNDYKRKYNENPEEKLEESKVLNSPITKLTNEEQNDDGVNDEIDFSHVKNILSRLNYYPLKEQDKKTARDLEQAIYSAEQNGLNIQLKEDINDGLSALLKIMSKYAV